MTSPSKLNLLEKFIETVPLKTRYLELDMLRESSITDSPSELLSSPYQLISISRTDV
jgi:hypothetical protein